MNHSFRLECAGWNDKTRLALEKLIRRGAGRNLPVVLDFDNTLLYGDIGEATLAVLIREGRIKASGISKTLSPTFRLPRQGRIRLGASVNPAAYYEAFQAPTVHGDRDPAPLSNGYAWAVEVMEHLHPSDVIAATRKATGFAAPKGPGYIEVASKGMRFPAPVFYPEMVDLIAGLLFHGFDVWVLSASNVWSVRWMVQEVLNPMLRARSIDRGLRPDHVIGISTLLTDRRGALHKDALLVKENPHYAELDEKTLRSFCLTSRLQFPVPTYSGKIACIFDALGTQPYLCAGDSPGDHPMLEFSQNRLWIARLEKPGFQERTTALIRRTGTAGWMIQPTLINGTGAFLPQVKDIRNCLGGLPQQVRTAASLVSTMGQQLSGS